jgi:hypothetical protein
MTVSIHLDKRNSVFTNLDVVSGTIVLSLAREETFSAITVKLECESRTRLAAPRNDRGRYDTELEVHKLLYKVETVFPTPQLIYASSGKGAAYTLPPGQHEYPFHLKVSSPWLDTLDQS